MLQLVPCCAGLLGVYYEDTVYWAVRLLEDLSVWVLSILRLVPRGRISGNYLVGLLHTVALFWIRHGPLHSLVVFAPFCHV